MTLGTRARSLDTRVEAFCAPIDKGRDESSRPGSLKAAPRNESSCFLAYLFPGGRLYRGTAGGRTRRRHKDPKYDCLTDVIHLEHLPYKASHRRR